MKKIQLIAFFSLWAVVAAAQTQPPGEPPLYYHSMALEDRIEELYIQRFFNDSLFREGELRTQKDLFTTQLGYRFDQVEQTIEVKTPTGKRIYLEPNDVVYCKLFFENQTVVFMPVTLPKKQSLTLVQVIYTTPTLQLYRDIRKELVNFEPKKDYRYYIRKGNKGHLKEVEINEKSLINALPEKRNRIAQFFKGKKKEDLTLSKVMHLMGELDDKNKEEN